MTCLYVLSVLSCASALPPSNSQFVYSIEYGLGERVSYYKIEPGLLPLWASWYNPSMDLGIPDSQNINCNDDCSTIATGTIEDWMYGSVAACPYDWLYETVVTPYGEYQCLDRGTAIKHGYRVYLDWRVQEWVEGWVITVDFMEKERPSWGYLPIYKWSFKEN